MRIADGVCWRLNVRSSHVHTVVEAEVPPERVMSDFKAYGSRRLNQMRLDEANRKAMSGNNPYNRSLTVAAPMHFQSRDREGAVAGH